MFAEKAVPRQLNLFVLLPCTFLSHFDDAVIHIQLAVFKRLAVVLVDETQTLERQVRVHIVDEVLKASKLPRVDIERPKNAIGKTTVQSMQSGAVRGYVGALTGIITDIQKELPP